MPNPQHAARLVNAVVDSYFEICEQKEDERNQRIIDTLEKESSTRFQEVQDLRDKLRELARQTDGAVAMFSSGDPSPLLRYPRADLQAKLATAEVEAAVLEAQIKAIEQQARRTRTTINCIQFGSGPLQVSDNFMNRLAQLTGGSYQYVDMGNR